MTIGEKRKILEQILRNNACGGVRCDTCPLACPDGMFSCGVGKPYGLSEKAGRILVELAIEEMLGRKR